MYICEYHKLNIHDTVTLLYIKRWKTQLANSSHKIMCVIALRQKCKLTRHSYILNNSNANTAPFLWVCVSSFCKRLCEQKGQ